MRYLAHSPLPTAPPLSYPAHPPFSALLIWLLLTWWRMPSVMSGSMGTAFARSLRQPEDGALP